MNKLLTIVIAAYNKEELLPRCLDSLLVPQVMNEVEVLIVNDGSKDNTIEIAREYERKYPGYFVVVDKENGNYGSVMNVGLKAAKGKYFRTLDADDYYDINVYEQYIEQLRHTDADLVLSERREIKEKSDWKNHVHFNDDINVNVDLQIKTEFWENKNILSVAYVMGFCYKTALLRDINMLWDEGIFFTDAEFCVLPLEKAKTVRFVPIPLYIYIRDVEGQSTAGGTKYISSYNVVAHRLLDSFMVLDASNPNRKLVEKFLLADILSYIYQTLITNGYEFKAMIDDLEARVKGLPEIYLRTDNYRHYRNLPYVHYYRKNNLKYNLFVRFDYFLRKKIHDLFH